MATQDLWSQFQSSMGRAKTQFSFYDAQQQAVQLEGWNQDYVQLSAGKFLGELTQLQGTYIRIFVERMQQSVYQTGHLQDGVLALGVPLDYSENGVFCGSVCGPDDIYVFSGKKGFEFKTPKQHTMLGIVLQTQAFKQSSAPLFQSQNKDAKLGSIIEPLLSGQDFYFTQPTLHLQQGSLLAVRDYLWSLLRVASHQPEMLSSHAIASAVLDFLLEHIQATQYDAIKSKTVKENNYWTMVQQACSLVKNHPEKTPSVAQLCLDIGVSRRTLQTGFNEVMGLSPLSYVKAVRLRNARSQLLDKRSVTDAATEFGFWHFGHFARDYQKMFGEKPSQTLLEHRNRLA